MVRLPTESGSQSSAEVPLTTDDTAQVPLPVLWMTQNSMHFKLMPRLAINYCCKPTQAVRSAVIWMTQNPTHFELMPHLAIDYCCIPPSRRPLKAIPPEPPPLSKTMCFALIPQMALIGCPNPKQYRLISPWETNCHIPRHFDLILHLVINCHYAPKPIARMTSPELSIRASNWVTVLRLIFDNQGAQQIQLQSPQKPPLLDHDFLTLWPEIAVPNIDVPVDKFVKRVILVIYEVSLYGYWK